MMSKPPVAATLPGLQAVVAPSAARLESLSDIARFGPSSAGRFVAQSRATALSLDPLDAQHCHARPLACDQFPPSRCRAVNRGCAMLNGRVAQVGDGLAATHSLEPAGSATIDILLVIAPHSLLLDIAGPAEAFRLANLHRDRRGLPPRFRLRFAGPVPTVRTSVGLSLLELEPLPESFSAPTWVVLVGQPAAHVGQVTPAIAATERWLDRMLGAHLATKNAPHRLVTICSGTLLAARAGLLTNRQCTTHHELLDALHALAPRAQVVDDCVFLVDGPFASSAGITAGIDLALHLIAQDCGEALAASVARDMVVYMRRSPLDAELSPFLAHRRHLHPVVHAVQVSVAADSKRNWDMASLAAVGHVSERHLLRLFREHAGVSPLQFLETIRLERARKSLERGASVTRAADTAGFQSGLQLRRAWQRQWGGSPRDAARKTPAMGSSSRTMSFVPAGHSYR
jgi:transcriptional regulator GlxA family with amidase domain